jgi:hypothetical protein
VSGKILTSSADCIKEFCKAMGLERVTKFVLTVECDEPVTLDVTCFPLEAALNVLLESTYQFELKEVPDSGHTKLRKYITGMRI